MTTIDEGKVRAFAAVALVVFRRAKVTLDELLESDYVNPAPGDTPFDTRVKAEIRRQIAN